MEKDQSLSIASEDLELLQLQESQNIEFVVEEDDQVSEENEDCDEPMYLYEEGLDEESTDTDKNETTDNNVENIKGQVSTSDGSSTDENDDYEMYESLDDGDITPKTTKTQNNSENNVPKQNTNNQSAKVTNKNDTTKYKDTSNTTQNKKLRAALSAKPKTNKSQYDEKIVMPKILKVQGGIISPTHELWKGGNPPNTTTIQSSPKTGTNPPTASSLGVQKFLPDKAVLQIINALGLSVEDIEKHGGTVAISIPDNLVKNGVLDLTKMSSVVQNATPSKVSQNVLFGVPFAPTPNPNPPITGQKACQNVILGTPSTTTSNPTIIGQNESSTRNNKVTPILPKKKCYVEGCETYEDKDNIFFSVPQDHETMKIWDICLNSINRRLSRTDKICTKHFYKSDIIVSKLKNTYPYEHIKFKLTSGAVPGVKFHNTCCVPGCGSKDPDRMYNFPAYNKTNNELWMYMVRNPSLKTLNIRELLRHRVCYKHFDSDCFSDDTELRRTAAPTKQLPVADYTAMLPQVRSSAAALNFSTIHLKCAYKKCVDRLNPAKKVFQFPGEFDRCQDWLYYCDRLDLLCPTVDGTMTKLYYLKFGLCENHFDHRDFEDRNKQFLNIYAVPKYFDGDTVIEDNQVISNNQANTQNDNDGDLLEMSRAKSNRILPYVCFYLGCNNKIPKRGNYQFYPFPKDPARRKLWLEACGYKNFGDVNVSYKICKMHFSYHMFDSDGKLLPTAVPLKSAQTVDGPNERRSDRTKNTVNRKKSLVEDFMNTEIPDENDGYFDTLDAIVAKWTDKSKLEFLRCAIPRCSKVFTNENCTGNAQMFPDPTEQMELYRKWLKVIGSPVLLAMTPDVLRQTYVVCNTHFNVDCLLDGNTRLTANTLPTKGIPVKPIEMSKENFQLYQPQTSTAPSTSTVTPVRSKPPPVRSYKFDGLQWKELDSVDLADSKDKTMCLLEDSNIVFPGMGYYLVDYPRDPKKINKRPYGVYQYKPSMTYGLTDDLEFGEALNIHTAIVIDDDDAVESEVMQKILDKRLKI